MAAVTDKNIVLSEPGGNRWKSLKIAVIPGMVLSTCLSSFTARTASAINTLPFSYFESNLVSFVTYQPLDGAGTKGLDSVYKDVFVCLGLAYFRKVKAKEDA